MPFISDPIKPEGPLEKEDPKLKKGERVKTQNEAPGYKVQAIRKVYEPFVHVALENPKTTLLIGLFAVLSALPLVPRLGSEFMPPLDEGDVLYMPTTFPGISIEEALELVLEE